MATVTIKHVTKAFGDNVVLKEFNETFRDGEFVTLLGPSGCGKTTMLRIIAGFEKPTSGELYIDDQLVSGGKTFVPPEKRSVGMVFQSYAVWPHMNVFDNVAYPLTIKKTPKAEVKERVDKVLEIVHLSQYAQRFPNQLSGGQQQRVALARALVIQPDVLLMDEPLSNLDAKLRVEMREAIRSIQRSVGITTVYVTHDQEEAMAVSDRIAVMNLGEIQQIGKPQAIYQRPANLFVASFIGRTNLLDGRIEMENDEAQLVVSGGYRVAMPNLLDSEKRDQKVVVSVRPEEFYIAEDERGIHATVDSSTFLGLNMHYFLTLDTGEKVQVIQEAELDRVLPDGARVCLGLKQKKLNIFCEDGSRNLVRGVLNDNVRTQEA